MVYNTYFLINDLIVIYVNNLTKVNDIIQKKLYNSKRKLQNSQIK